MAWIYKTPLFQRYYASRTSLAYWISWLFWVVVFILPFWLAFFSPNFWKKHEVFSEQPLLNFRHELVVFASGVDTNLAWGTFPEFNALFPNELRPVEVLFNVDDSDNDGNADFFDLEISFPLKSGESIQDIFVAMQFNCKLEDFIRYEMVSSVVLQSSYSLPSSELEVEGDILFHQTMPLQAVGATRSEYLIPTLTRATIKSIEDVLPIRIVRDSLSRNHTLRVDAPYYIWKAGTTDSFKLKARLYNSLQTIHYSPGVPELLKFAFLQYFPLFSLVLVIADFLMYYLITEQSLSSTAKSDVAPTSKLHIF